MELLLVTPLKIETEKWESEKREIPRQQRVERRCL
jgi:hypothetical protein